MTRHARPPLPIATRLRRLAATGVALGSLVGVPSAFQMLFAEPMHSTAAAAQPPVHAIDRDSDGLFHARIVISGRPVDCLVDTGASALTLPYATARKLGVATHASERGRLATASGSVRADRLTIDDVSLAGRHFADVQAVLVHGATGPCLIGQELLARLDAVELRGGRMHLR